MKKAHIVIIGGSAAGVTAAITCRRHYPDKEVLLIRKEREALIPCGIPYIFGTLGSIEKNLLPDAVVKGSGAEILIDEVVDVKRDEKIVITAGGERIAYDKLIISTGSVPGIPPIPGIDMDNIFPIEKNAESLKKVMERLKGASNLVIVGGGFIGMEFADECRKSFKAKITVVEMLPHPLMLNFDEELCIAAEEIEKKMGVDIMAPERVESFIGNGKVKGVRLASGKEIEADMALIATGYVPNTKLAEKIGLEIGPTKAIKVDRYMRTNDENIFACGDCAEKFSFFDGKPSNLRLASIAAMEARIASANLFGPRRMNEGVIGVFSTILSGTVFALAGLSEKEAKAKGYEITVGKWEGVNRHPGSMPEAENLKLKLIFEKGTGVILGGELMGAKSGGEIINIIGAAISKRMTAEEIARSQMGTHPALTASPIAYPIPNAAEMACIGP